MAEQQLNPNAINFEDDLSGNVTAPIAAMFLGITTSTLAAWRQRNYGPPYIRTGTRIVLYPKADLVQWIENNKTRPGAEG